MSTRFDRLVRLGFEAARLLPDIAEPGNALRHGGHSFGVRIAAPTPPSLSAAVRCADPLSDLHRHLARALRELDYALLNERINEPDDAALLTWLREHLQLDADAELALDSAPRHGARSVAGELRVSRRFRFEAAHRLPNVPEGHQCGRMHGHGFEVGIECALDDTAGALHTAMAIERAWRPLFAQLDHRCLNDIPGLENPTSELIAAWAWPRLQDALPGVREISVQETDTAGCRHDGERFRIWKDQRFESAVVLTDAAPGDPRRQLHGHSYHLRLELVAPLDAVFGWTVDFGDVKTLFNPIYKRLDHHRLNDLSGVESGDPCALLAWIQAEAAPSLPTLRRIELMETPERGARVSW